MTSFPHYYLFLCSPFLHGRSVSIRTVSIISDRLLAYYFYPNSTISHFLVLRSLFFSLFFSFSPTTSYTYCHSAKTQPTCNPTPPNPISPKNHQPPTPPKASGIDGNSFLPLMTLLLSGAHKSQETNFVNAATAEVGEGSGGICVWLDGGILRG